MNLNQLATEMDKALLHGEWSELERLEAQGLKMASKEDLRRAVQHAMDVRLGTARVELMLRRGY